jgi:hypothetical protein
MLFHVSHMLGPQVNHCDLMAATDQHSSNVCANRTRAKNANMHIYVSAR